MARFFVYDSTNPPAIAATGQIKQTPARSPVSL